MILKIYIYIKMKITNIFGLTDGFGECFKFVLYAVFYCEFMKEEFYYTPAFTNSLNHNYYNDPDYTNKKEEFINFKNNYPLVTNDCHSLGKMQYISFFEKNIQIKKIKSIFKNKNKNRFNNVIKNIAVHIRRTNSYDKDIELPGLDIPNSVYENIVIQLKNLYKDSLIHIYSQGVNNDFEYLKGDNIVFHLNETVEQTFTDFVYADVLVISPSALSYSAGLLSDGIIYYIQHCHRPLKHWNIIKGYISTRDRYTFKISTYNPPKIIHYDVDNELFYVERN